MDASVPSAIGGCADALKASDKGTQSSPRAVATAELARRGGCAVIRKALAKQRLTRLRKAPARQAEAWVQNLF